MQEDQDQPPVAMNYDSGIRDWLLTSELHYSPVEQHQLLLGANYTFHTFRPEMTSVKVNGKDLNDFSGTDFDVFGSNPKIYAHEASLYAEDEMKLGDKWSFNAGLRYSFYYCLLYTSRCV